MRVDVRGLSCPQPVMLVHRKMYELKSGTFEVLGDDETAHGNLLRLCRDKGWQVSEKRKGDVWLLTISK